MTRKYKLFLYSAFTMKVFVKIWCIFLILSIQKNYIFFCYLLNNDLSYKITNDLFFIIRNYGKQKCNVNQNSW